MELCDCNLFEIIEAQKKTKSVSHKGDWKGILSEQAIKSIALQVLYGLEFLHSTKKTIQNKDRMLVHGDLRSVNVFCTESGTAKIGDCKSFPELCSFTKHFIQWNS